MEKNKIKSENIIKKKEKLMEDENEQNTKKKLSIWMNYVMEMKVKDTRKEKKC